MKHECVVVRVPLQILFSDGCDATRALQLFRPGNH